MINKTLKAANLKIIRHLKKEISEFGATAVAKKAKMIRGTLYFHLDEDKAENVNLDALKVISDAIAAIKQDIVNKQAQLSKQNSL